MPLNALILTVAALLLSGCAQIAEYNSRVSERSDSLSGYTKDGGYGIRLTHKVYYK